MLFDVLGVAFAGAKSPLWVLPKQLDTEVAFINRLNIIDIIYDKKLSSKLTLLMIAIASNDRNLGYRTSSFTIESNT